MITKQEIKKVEKLQGIEQEIRNLEQDYWNVKSMALCYLDRLDWLPFREKHDKELARIIKHKILKLKRKRKELLEGK